MSTPVTEQAAALQVEATSRALHLPTVRQQAAALAEAALRDRLTHLAYLAEVLSAELDDRDARRRERRIHEARFPRLKHLADFDLAAAPTVDPTMLATLERGEWIAAGQPVVLLGDSGTGKSHLLIGLGMAACQRGLRVRYTTAAALVNELAEAADERTLSRLVARYFVGPGRVGPLHMPSHPLSAPEIERRMVHCRVEQFPQSLHRQVSMRRSGGRASPCWVRGPHRLAPRLVCDDQWSRGQGVAAA